MASILDYLSSADPLARAATLFLLSYEEEDDRVDYKQSFDPSSEKSWLETTKDISAFANTWGGYLVFGVTDTERMVVGLSRSVANILKDANNLQQKLNRHLEPHLVAVRAKEFRIEGKVVVVVFTPRSQGTTHLISKDGSFKYPSGESKVVLRKGTFYVRRTAGNHLAELAGPN